MPPALQAVEARDIQLQHSYTQMQQAVHMAFKSLADK
jgi:hypothetical protein